MSRSLKLRWQKYLNELRYVHQEVDATMALCRASAIEFQDHYEQFCRENDIDLAMLNQTHAETLREIYPAQVPLEEPAELETESNSDCAITITESFPSKTRDELDETNKDDQEIHEAFSKLFRKLALKLHPDKIAQAARADESEEKLHMFKEAKEALDKKRYFVLLDIAEKLKISAPQNYKQQIRWMKKEIKNLKNNTEQQKSTYNYLFAECDTREQQDALIKRFMSQIFGPKIFQQ